MSSFYHSMSAFIGVGNRTSASIRFHDYNGKVVAEISVNVPFNEGYTTWDFTSAWEKQLGCFLTQVLNAWEVPLMPFDFDFASAHKRGNTFALRNTTISRIARAALLRWDDKVAHAIEVFLTDAFKTVDAYSTFEYGCEQLEAIMRWVMQINHVNGDKINFKVAKGT